MAKDSITFAAGQEEPVYESGAFFRFLEGDHPIRVRFLGADKDTELEIDPGIGVRVPGGWDYLLIRSPNAQTVTFATFEAEIWDNRRSGQVVTLTKAGTLAAPGDVSAAAGTETQILASDPDRREAVIVSDPGNTDPVRIGGAGVTATSGVRLDPGQSITLETTAAIYAHAVASNATMQALEVKD